MKDFKPDARELPVDRLATSDQRGNRVYLYPAEVKGPFRQYRRAVHLVLMAVFLALPWIRIGGHQSIFFDVLNGRLTIFGIRFWAHDAPILVFIFGGAALTLGLVTAVWGRVWCGWACPQTVFIDSLFRWIERMVEGDHLERKQLDSQPWGAEKTYKKVVKWSAFSLVALVLTHSFLAYFVGTEELAQMVRSSPAKSPLSFLVMLGLAGLILFDFGWFREQFCTVVCPYGRFQSLLMDERSLLVSYDPVRGEPRKGSVPEGERAGDCVNCFRCVQVCPTGIDIRRGAQLECIACTACIDACDDVMSRLHRPRGLIRYDSEAGLQGKKISAVSGRVLAYATLIFLAATGLTFSVRSRKAVEATFVRTAGDPYQEALEDGEKKVINRFRADLRNQSFSDLKVTFQASAAAGSVPVVTAQGFVLVGAGRKIGQDIFLKFPARYLQGGRANAKLEVLDPEGKELFVEEVVLVGPYR